MIFDLTKGGLSIQLRYWVGVGGVGGRGVGGDGTLT